MLQLALGPADDRQELEADRVATRVMHRQEPTGARVGPAAELPGAAPGSVGDVLRMPGRPLDAATLGFFQPRFGRDFRDVRVHTDGAAAAAVEDVRAQAYTVGRHIAFGAGRYAPGTAAGRALLAHELAHVVQQRGTGRERVQRAVEVRPPGRGEASAFDRRGELIDRMNGFGTGVTYRLEGQSIAYTVTDATRVSPFDRQMQGFIDRAVVVPLRLITSAGRVGGQNVFTDAFDQGYVDVDDLKACDDNSFKMNLLHVMAERFSVKNYERRIGTNFGDAEFARAHAAGLEAETQYLRDTVGDPTIRFVFEEKRPDGTAEFGYRSAEGYRIFHVFRGTAQAVSGGHVFVQTRDKRSITLEQLIVERRRAAP